MHHRKTLLELYQCTKLHVHYVPNHQMQCTIELHTLNSISVPNLVSLAQNFLEPKDPSNEVFRSWRVQPAPHENGNQKSTQMRVVYV